MSHKKNCLSFAEAREYVHSLDLASRTTYAEWFAKHRPANIPSQPQVFYKEWQGWSDWLGNGARVLPFEEARELARQIAKEHGIYTCKQWKQWHRENNPFRLPFEPRACYYDWKGWSDWLGQDKYLPFKEAREVARQAQVKAHDWFNWYAANKPFRVPSRPDRVYDEWINWSDWVNE